MLIVRLLALRLFLFAIALDFVDVGTPVTEKSSLLVVVLLPTLPRPLRPDKCMDSMAGQLLILEDFNESFDFAFEELSSVALSCNEHFVKVHIVLLTDQLLLLDLLDCLLLLLGRYLLLSFE